MKAKFDRTFEYGKNISKYCVIFAIALCVLSLLVPQGTYLQVILIAATLAMLVATVVVMYKFCRCPYCGKRIMLGVLRVKSCPRCRRSLTTGKKMK